MKRLLLLGLVAVSVVSMGGCRWCGWTREGDMCNACQCPGGPTGYPSDVYYGGEVYGDVNGAIVDGQIQEHGMPMIAIPENLPSPAGAR